MRSSKRPCTWPAPWPKIALPGQQLAQHGLAGLGHALLELARGADAAIALGARFLVGPVRGHAVLGMLVHLLGADLHLQRPALVVQHHGVQRR
jgi:hypothetical protein